jgi:hypothetical protein
MTDADGAARGGTEDLDPAPLDLSDGQPVDEPVADEPGPGDHDGGVWGGKAATDDDGIPDFDGEDSEEVEATLGDDSYDEAEAEPESEGPQ